MGALMDFLKTNKLAANSANTAKLTTEKPQDDDRLATLASLASTDIKTEFYEPAEQEPLQINTQFEHVTCASCKHIIHSVLNPGVGWGRCTVSEKYGDFPRRRHNCQDHQPAE